MDFYWVSFGISKKISIFAFEQINTKPSLIYIRLNVVRISYN